METFQLLPERKKLKAKRAEKLKWHCPERNARSFSVCIILSSRTRQGGILDELPLGKESLWHCSAHSVAIAERLTPKEWVARFVR